MSFTLIGRKNQGEARENWRPAEYTTERSAVEVYIVQAPSTTPPDYTTETEVDVGTTALVPQLSDQSSDNPGLYCIDRDIKLQPGSDNVWEITCYFTNNPWSGLNGAGGDGGGSGSISTPSIPTYPWQEKARISVSTERVQTQSLYDAAGNAFATSAGEVLDGFTVQLPVAVYVARQYDIFADVKFLMSMVGKTHDATGSGIFISGYSDYEVLFDDVAANPVNVSGYDCWEMTYRFKCLSRGVCPANSLAIGTSTSVTATPIGWRMLLPNYGTFRKPDGSETVFDTTAVREKQRPRWWLKTDGTWAADASLLTQRSWLVAQPHGEANLKLLGVRF